MEQQQARQTCGRKRLGQTETKITAFKLPLDIKERLKTASSSMGLNNSEIMRIALEAWLDKFESLN